MWWVAGAKAAKKAEGAQAPVSARGRTSKPRRFYSQSADSDDDDASDGSNRRRKHHNPWCALACCASAAGDLNIAPALRSTNWAGVALPRAVSCATRHLIGVGGLLSAPAWRTVVHLG